MLGLLFGRESSLFSEVGRSGGPAGRCLEVDAVDFKAGNCAMHANSFALLLLTLYSKAFAIFSLPEATWFGASLRHFGLVLLHLAVKVSGTAALGSRDSPSCSRSPTPFVMTNQADKYQVQTSSTKNPCITDAASKLSKAAGLAAIDRTPAAGQETKRREVLWLANLSFYAYFKVSLWSVAAMLGASLTSHARRLGQLNNLRLCDTVLSSVDSAFALNRQFAPLATSALAGANADQGESCYSRADRVTYRYYLGRLRLMQHRIRVVRGHQLLLAEARRTR